MSDSQAPTGALPAPSETFAVERKDCDLPFYRGVPVGFPPTGWLFVLASVALAFVALSYAQLRFSTGLLAFVPAILFVGIPLGTLALVGGPRAPLALFRRMRGRDWLLILAFFALNWVVTVILGLVVTSVFETVSNPAGDRVVNAAPLDQVLFFAWTAVQLLGEEIFTVLPFLAFLAFFDRVMPRKAAICLAAIGAAVIFALIHLPTYQWHVAQTLLTLAPVRIVLLLPFIVTRNIWVSTGVHVLNDWTIFGLALAGSAFAGGG